MLFSSLRTAAFRNLADSEVNTCARDVFLIGENGQGKTNFLEAVYFCCCASSFRGVRDSEIARNNTGSFSAAVKLSANPGCSAEENMPGGEILVKSEKGKKSILISGKKAEERRDLLTIAPCIVFCHEDMDFISGSPERRRWFFDQVLSLYDPVYLDDFRRFRQVLKFRNATLRDYSRHIVSGDIESLLDALDVQFVQYGVKLIEKRMAAVGLFSQVFTPLYREVSGIDNITVQYIPSWKTGSGACAGTDEAAAALAGRRAADLGAGVSLSGPQRDRYVFLCDKGEFTAKASTGQRRLLALLLRLAQARRFSDMTGKKPTLLLDDVLLEMDGAKREKFLAIMPGYNQAFYTFLPEEPYQRYRKNDTLVYNVNGGVLS